MKDVIYLRCDQAGVRGMTKGMPALHRGEIPVKLVIEIKAAAFREPVVEQKITIEDWRGGVDLADIDLREAVITQAEADVIRASRLDRMKAVLAGHGYTIVDPHDPELDLSWLDEPHEHGEGFGPHPGWLGHDGLAVHRHDLASGRVQLEDSVRQDSP
jgi:hypothetical protein